MKTKFLLAISPLLFLTWHVQAQRFPRAHPDDFVYDGRIVEVKGQIRILSHPDPNISVFSGGGIVFQRVGCRDCLISVSADENGRYQVFLGRGRYKVIMRGGSGGLNPTYDMLAPDQPRYVEAKQSPYATEFDIKVVLPKDR
jgi:hypothetical protein